MTTLTPTGEQQAILDLGLTSIRVRAGAGTGKTTTVGMVIAGLVENHSVEPEQILGITFTNKAAAELADRVRRSLPETIDRSRQVEIHTYHGFASQVLSEFGPIAGVGRRARVITAAFARQLMLEVTRRQPFTRVDVTVPSGLDKIRRLGDRLGDHLLDADDIIDAAPADPDDVWAARLEMAETLRRRQAEKRRLGVVDYADLITLSAQLTTEHPGLAETIRERYRAVVLDEYQDTNPAQRELLLRIFGRGFPVVAVGDEDQTIYEWRGASPESFELFPAQFTTPEGAPAHQRELTLNRRSAQKILDVANRVRRLANPEADELKAADESAPGEIRAHWAADALAEADWVARCFQDLRDQGAAWSDMAVLFRKNRDFPIVVGAFMRREIPVEVAAVGGLLSVPEVAELRAWLTVLDRPEDSSALTQILFGRRRRLGLADLAPLTRWVSGAADGGVDSDNPAPVTLIEAVEAAGEIAGVRDGARPAFDRFTRVYRGLLTESQGQSLVETCRTVLDRTRSWRDIEALPPTARLTARLNVHRFLDIAEEWSPLRGRPSVAAFLDYLDAMEEEPADELDSARLSGEDAVTLVTVHRAKGLEWDNVAIPALTKGAFPAVSRGFPDPLRFAEHVPVEMRLDHVMDDLPADEKERADLLRARHAAQEHRLAYVALTRARRRLFVSGAHWYGQAEPTKRPRAPSPLFELAEAHADHSERAELGERPALLKPPDEAQAPDPLFGSGWDAMLRAAIDDRLAPAELAAEAGLTDEYEKIAADMTQRLFELAKPMKAAEPEPGGAVSVSGLVTYAQCPKRFYWSDIDPLPRRPSPAAARGTETHRRIELHQRGRIPFDELSDDLYDLVDADRAESGPGAYETYRGSRFAAERAALIETPFTLELASGYKVRGRIDAVYTGPDGWEIVDFKSGRPSDDPSRLVQLQAYATAASEVDLGLGRPEKIKVTFAYLGGGLHEASYDASRDWVTEAKATLEALTKAIGESRFGESAGPWCGSCDFLRFCDPGQSEVGR